MKAFYKGNAAEVWTIGRHNEQPDWVKKAFDENYIVWLDGHVRVLMSGLNPSLGSNLKTGAVGTAGGGFAGYNMYVLGYPGDVLDLTNHHIVSEKQFKKQYRLDS
ncbi:hypothetical protein ACFQ5J_04700 [Lacticaseibacillus baoqingensis]|uniref:Role in replication n=1 Tax=Lacticaseibacillus baoqingensis TaxID=2486013 RepID=A0ABW4E5V8_9LACO|nr:hypothetical protein [Lacticaseibacillus baoqingensis]